MTDKNQFKENWDALDFSAPLNESQSKMLWKGVYKKTLRKRKVKTVSGVLLLFVLSGVSAVALWPNPSVTSQRFVTAQAEEYLVLSDSSRVLLKQNSELIVGSDFNSSNRKVYLKGNAIFEVKHSDTYEFTVIDSSFQTVVLGTRFEVDTDDQRSFVRLYQGKVRIDTKERNFVLSPGHQWTAGMGVSQTLQAVFTGDYSSEDLQLVMSEIQHFYGVKIAYPAALETEKVTGAIRGNLQEILNTLAYPFDLTIVKKGGVYELK